jgi:hypothetical protein
VLNPPLLVIVMIAALLKVTRPTAMYTLVWVVSSVLACRAARASGGRDAR